MLAYFRIANMPFLLKIALAPAVALAALAIVTWNGANSITSQSGSIATVARSGDSNEVLIGALVGIQQINGSLYRILALRAASTKGLDSAAELQALNGRIDNVVHQLTVYRDTYCDKETATKIDGLIADVTKYKGAVNWVGQMLDLDFSSAVGFLAPFEANFNSMNDRMEQLKSEVASGRQHTVSAATELADQTRKGFIIGAGLAVVVTGLLAAFVAFVTGASIQSIATSTRRLATGDISVDINALQRGDELGAIVESLRIFRDNIEKVAALQNEQAELKRASEREQRRSLLELADKLDNSVTSVITVLSERAKNMQNSAGALSSSATETRQEVQAVATTTTDVTGHANTVSGATTQLSLSIQEISQQVTQAATVAAQAAEEIGQTSSLANALEQTAQRIGSVVQLINSIAGQTNLLALNATIEAARAGDMGKGFAVVASEVKQLANQTARATEEIENQVASMQEATGSVAQRVSKITEVIGTLSNISQAIAAAVEEQSTTTREISRSVIQLAEGTSSVAARIGGVSKASHGTGSAAGEVLTAANDLAEQSTILRDVVGHFLTQVRA